MKILKEMMADFFDTFCRGCVWGLGFWTSLLVLLATARWIAPLFGVVI